MKLFSCFISFSAYFINKAAYLKNGGFLPTGSTCIVNVVISGVMDESVQMNVPLDRGNPILHDVRGEGGDEKR